MTTTDVRVLAAYLAPHLHGARVLYVGDLDDAEPLFDAGARLVHVYRFTKPQRSLSGAVLVQSLQRGLDLPTGGFDLAIVEDLERVGSRLDLLASLRAGLGARGVGVLVARTGAGHIDYTELYDACSTLFEHVTMVGKLPFSGTLLCELGLEHEPEVSVDTELAEQEPPQTLLALVSQRAFSVEEYAIFAHAPISVPVAAAPEPDLLHVAEMSQLTLQNQALAAQLQEEREVRSQAAALSRDLEAALAASASAREEALQLRNALAAALAEQEASSAQRDLIVTSELEIDKTLSELALQSERAEESEARAHASEARLAEAEIRLAEAKTRLAEAEIRMGQLQAEARAVEREREQAVARAGLAEARQAELEQAERALRAQLGQRGQARAEETELVALESTLRQRGQVILELQAELARRERMITQLLLGERFREASSETPELERKLDQLAQEVARRQGELEARGWRIQELETALAGIVKTPES